MKLTNTDLHQHVLEDGEAADVIQPGLTASGTGQETKLVNIDAHPGHTELQPVTMGTKSRVAVETSDEDCGKDVDDLTESLRGCGIQETAPRDLEHQFSQLTVSEGETEGEEPVDLSITGEGGASLQSQSSIIAVDPPSLSSEGGGEEEEGEGDGDLIDRGPMGGRPTAFLPDQPDYNHVAAKAYSSHNLSRFAGPSPPYPLTHPQHFPQYAQYNNLNAEAGGKRGLDDDINPYKFQRPGNASHHGNEGYPGNQLPPFTGVGQQEECGELLTGRYLETQVSLTDVDSMLEILDQQQQQQSYASNTSSTLPYNKTAHFPQECDAGYSSENSPHSEAVASPGSSPNAFSPMQPPSNMSHDSGIASPYSDHTATHSPHSRPGSEDLAVSPFPSPFMAGAPPTPLSATDDLSMTSAPSPPNTTDLDLFFDDHKAELKAALEVVAGQLKDDKKAPPSNTPVTLDSAPFTQAYTPVTTSHAHPMFVPAPYPAASPLGPAPSPAGHTPSPPGHAPLSNIPTSVMPMSGGRPGKVAIPPLHKAGGGGRAGGGGLKGGPVPVMVVQTTIGSQPGTVSTPITSQPVLVVPNPTQGQSQMIFVIGQQPSPPPARPKLKKLLPKTSPATPPNAATTPPPPASTAKANNSGSGKTESRLPGVASPAANSTSNGAGGQQPNNNNNNKKAPNGRPPQQNRNLNRARRLVASMTSADLQYMDREGDTYLHVSVCKTDHNMVRALLERMQREELQDMINSQNNSRQTPLYLAVSSNAPEMVKLLLQYNAEVNVFAQQFMADGVSLEANAAVHIAASKGDHYLATMQALLASPDLSIDIFNSAGHTALHCAILEHNKPAPEGGVVSNLSVIQALIRAGADPNSQVRRNGKTALMYTLESRDLDLIEAVTALIDPVRLRSFLKVPTFDNITCLKLLDSVQKSLDPAGRQRLHSCLRIASPRRDHC